MGDWWDFLGTQHLLSVIRRYRGLWSPQGAGCKVEPYRVRGLIYSYLMNHHSVSLKVKMSHSNQSPSCPIFISVGYIIMRPVPFLALGYNMRLEALRTWNQKSYFQVPATFK